MLGNAGSSAGASVFTMRYSEPHRKHAKMPYPLPIGVSSVAHWAAKSAYSFFIALAASVNFSLGTEQKTTLEGYWYSSMKRTSWPSSAVMASLSMLISAAPPRYETTGSENPEDKFL